jgi:FkbM family methyltransferase
MGHSFEIAIKDPVAEEWYGAAGKTGTLAPPAEINWLQELVNQKKLPQVLQDHFQSKSCTVFDLGAHQGIVALIFEKLFSTSGKIIALEAGSHNFKILQENIKTNHAKNIIPLHRAAGDAPGFIEFDESMNGEVSAEKMPALSSKVQVSTIDGLSEEFGTPDLVLIDVEGYEYPVLKGATRTVSLKKTVFVIEIHHEHQRVRYGSDLKKIKDIFPSTSKFLVGYTETGKIQVLVGDDWLKKTDKFFLIVTPE